MWLSALFSLSVSVGVSFASAPNGPWNAFNLAPASRIVTSTAIYKQAGSVKNAEALLTSTGNTTLSGSNSFVSLDFGKEVISLIRLASQSYLFRSFILGRGSDRAELISVF